MAVRVVLTNASRVTRRTPHEESDEDLDIRISRNTYQRLGSLIQNKLVQSMYENGNLPGEFVRLLEELNDLYLVKNYPELATDIELAPGIEELDEYLGSLGIDIEYHYDKDAVNIDQWLSIEEVSDVRVLMDPVDGTYLSDSDGAEILVRYKD